jgi:hypothetical protein
VKTAHRTVTTMFAGNDRSRSEMLRSTLAVASLLAPSRMLADSFASSVAAAVVIFCRLAVGGGGGSSMMKIAYERPGGNQQKYAREHSNRVVVRIRSGE